MRLWLWQDMESAHMHGERNGEVSDLRACFPLEGVHVRSVNRIKTNIEYKIETVTFDGDCSQSSAGNTIPMT